MQLDPTLTLGDAEIKPSACVKNQGAHMDSYADMAVQCRSVSRSMFFHLRRICQIRCHLDQVAAARAIQATVVSRLDYCNSLLFGANQCHISALQRAQNAATRVLKGVNRRAHMKPILQSLHWLPVRRRIEFKILVLVFTLLHDPYAPQYLISLLSHYVPTRSLRSGQSCMPLVIPRSCSQAGDRAFITCAPRLRNNLPETVNASPSVHVFKMRLKTHLFQVEY
jgi:hypothetical protein